MSKVTGTVKFFNPDKGYGFITVAETQEDIFVHHTGIVKEGYRSLGLGEQVEFNISTRETDGKKQATEVTGPNGAPVIGSIRPRTDRKPTGGRRFSRDNREDSH